MAQVLHKSDAFREAEFKRQRALDAYRIVDTLPEAAFDDIAKVAAAVCDAPVALVSLIDRDRQWFKARVGTDVTGTPRDEAVCDVAIRNPSELLEVPDIASDPRFARAPSVAGVAGARFYAGMPLVTPGGAAIGAVCVEACLRPGSGDAIDRTTGSPEYVAVLHGDDPGPVLARLRRAADAAAHEAGLTLCVGAATAEDGHEPLEAVFIRADERLSAEKDRLHPPPPTAA